MKTFMEFISQVIDYFVNPWGSGYTFSKTLIFGFLLIFCTYGIYLFLQKLKIKVDKRLVASVIFFVLLGSTLRVYEDLGIYRSYWLVTPGIYFLFSALAICSLLIGVKIEKKTKLSYEMFPLTLSLSLWAIFFANLPFYNLLPLIYILIFHIPLLFGLTTLKRLLSKEDLAVIFSQTYDGIVTFVALQLFGFKEKHILPNYIFSLTKAFWIFPILKFTVTLAVVWILNYSIKDRAFRNYIKLIMGLLGIATGTRDLLDLLVLS